MQREKLQLPLQTSSLIAGFMVWVLISSLMPSIKQDIDLTNQQTALVTAVPVILGSILRVPLGYYTNKYGARLMFSISFFILLFPVYYISMAASFIDLIIGGLILGLGGATFSIGVTSLPKYYPSEKHGFVNGIYGAGNIGTAITAFSAPVLASTLGWETTVRVYLILLILFGILNLAFGDKKEKRINIPIKQQLSAVYKNTTLWALCLFYFITFGSFVAFTIYLPDFLSNNFGLTAVDAGLRTAGFIALSTLFRPVGGWLSDRFNPFIILIGVFSGLTFSGVLLSFSPTIELYTVGVLTVAFCAGIGNGTVFKLVPLYFSKQAGIVNGLVAAMGGLGGFFPPLVLTTVFSITGHYSIGFMALSEVSLASLVIVLWMFYQDKLQVESKIINSTAQGMMITDKQGVIQKVNPAFTTVTGYEPEEVIGKKPSVLRSGHHGPLFYENLWDQLNDQGYWEGNIWNKRKNGETYLEWLTISKVRNDAGELIYYVGQFNDLSRHIEEQKITQE
ncbi:MFS transporter [Halobacillus andaensis]|uniref:MFS transporter n=1 Tax=Halobacillus andaensis TaxID=1176239 RepID=A0A917B8B1_HALAA|nr:nitrate/nitrite transporter [Halobacillus andaensis]MBP2005769.1 NNP family nitrate/nitrite transporter-like MFS transporter [Halobacillus andaensis]GGF26170.1 MFS transporter [Halobacillus andaensis]